MPIGLRNLGDLWHSRLVDSLRTKQRIAEKKPLVARLRDSVDWLDFILGEFVEGKTKSVSGNENRNRLAKALATLHDLEKELTGKN